MRDEVVSAWQNPCAQNSDRGLSNRSDARLPWLGRMRELTTRRLALTCAMFAADCQPGISKRSEPNAHAVDFPAVLDASGERLGMSQTLTANALAKDFRETVIAEALAKMTKQVSGEVIRVLGSLQSSLAPRKTGLHVTPRSPSGGYSQRCRLSCKPVSRQSEPVHTSAPKPWKQKQGTEPRDSFMHFAGHCAEAHGVVDVWLPRWARAETESRFQRGAAPACEAYRKRADSRTWPAGNASH